MTRSLPGRLTLLALLLASVLADVTSAPLLAPTPGGPSYLLYLREQDLVAQEFDEQTGTVRGREMVVVPGVGAVANPAVRPAVGVSPRGILAYQTDQGDETGVLRWFDRAGKVLRVLPAELFVDAPSLS